MSSNDDFVVKPTANSARNSSRRRPSKRTRQTSSLAQMTVTEELDEEEQTLETVPDHLSTSASETSSKGSNSSQPPLLDFIGATCMASAWFTSCFPCAVVDIDDNDNCVVDKLSRESAMNVMYANNASGRVMPGASPELAAQQRRGIQTRGSDQEENMIFVQLPPPPSNQKEQASSSRRSGSGMNHHPVPLHSVPSVIQEGSEDSSDNMDEIFLNDDENDKAKSSTNGIAKPERLDREDSGIVDTRSPVVDRQASKNLTHPNGKKLGKMTSVKKMFGRKKKA